MDKKVILDLFSGSKSVSKAMKRNKDFIVITLDHESKFDPDILTNILKWNEKKAAFIPSYIWASPPCNTFSFLNPKAGRNRKTGKAISDKAKEGDKFLNKTLRIIKHFQKINPKLKFVIENPKAMMRLMPQLKKFKRYTVLYCNYGLNVRKPTDLFTNDFNLKLNEETKCDNPKHVVPVVSLCSSFERSKVPQKLIRTIIKQFEMNA